MFVDRVRLVFEVLNTESRLTGYGTDYWLVLTRKTPGISRCCNLSVRPDGPQAKPTKPTRA